MPPIQGSGLPPRVFIIQSTLRDPITHRPLVLDYTLNQQDGTNLLILAPVPFGSTPETQKFRVYEKGQIQNLALTNAPTVDNGYLTRLQDGTNRVSLEQWKGEEKDQVQVWNFKEGPDPKDEGHGGGPAGIDEFTITLDDALIKPPLVPLILTHQGNGQNVIVQPKEVPGNKKVDDNQLWYYFWLLEI
jgi:hypothetical protein